MRSTLLIAVCALLVSSTASFAGSDHQVAAKRGDVIDSGLDTRVTGCDSQYKLVTIHGPGYWGGGSYDSMDHTIGVGREAYFENGSRSIHVQLLGFVADGATCRAALRVY